MGGAFHFLTRNDQVTPNTCKRQLVGWFWEAGLNKDWEDREDWLDFPDLFFKDFIYCQFRSLGSCLLENNHFFYRARGRRLRSL